ncbi:hypothetical protein B4U79_16150 [Dinothrombium tinctorium]|uniref:Group XV phospholipase A2-like protein n=1 Tax=Dinothrombium tinctorium TaxID=1965070 RepID=A0A3S3PS41_9ACAR|nr:hypothetical protein B4U79_16150 [Dinothrombium tinctorium]
MIENLYEKNGQRPVILVGHSMGGNIAYLFLLQKSLEWKNKYIRCMLTIGTPWGGGFKYLYDYLFDDDFFANYFKVIRSAERTYSAYSYLLPDPNVWNDLVLVETPSFNYTAHDLPKFLLDIQNENAYNMYLDTMNTNEDYKHPETNVYCIGGSGFKTLRSLKYSSDDFNSQPTVIYENGGDEFVNEIAMRHCLKWQTNGNFSFNFKVLNYNHLDLIRNENASKLIAEIVVNMS